jgi:hypothetical protein
MDQRLENTWIYQRVKRKLFRCNHYFISGNKSACGQCTIWPEDEQYLKPIKFEEIFIRKICKRCVLACETKSIKYKA